ncbi:uncharacterized protein LOC110401853 [Numida meleagris]|uniref:uncharacterized protein LOC110401853 n=1 Tax=Numida meleagris TaxID=8996 RepID=UPI000B3D9CE5|nr:uncharacterized protein LOC110401853 [Numida meleagris]
MLAGHDSKAHGMQYGYSYSEAQQACLDTCSAGSPRPHNRYLPGLSSASRPGPALLARGARPAPPPSRSQDADAPPPPPPPALLGPASYGRPCPARAARLPASVSRPRCPPQPPALSGAGHREPRAWRLLRGGRGTCSRSVPAVKREVPTGGGCLGSPSQQRLLPSEHLRGRPAASDEPGEDLMFVKCGIAVMWRAGGAPVARGWSGELHGRRISPHLLLPTSPGHLAWEGAGTAACESLWTCRTGTERVSPVHRNYRTRQKEPSVPPQYAFFLGEENHQKIRL